MKKRVLSAIMAGVISVMLIPTAFAENLSAEYVREYMRVMEGRSNVDSYFVDFDGDGKDELLIIDDSVGETGKYQVWQGGNLIADEQLKYIANNKRDSSYYSIAQSSEYSDKLFLRYYFYGEVQNTETYTILNGKWTKVDATHYEWYYGNPNDEDAKVCFVNDVRYNPMSDMESFREAEKRVNDKYTDLYKIEDGHYDANMLINIASISQNFPDVLGPMPQSAKRSLFDEFLGLAVIGGAEGIYGPQITDDDFFTILFVMWLSDHPGLDDYYTYDSGYYKYDADELNDLAYRYCGHKIDVEKYRTSTLPQPDGQRRIYYKDGNIYFYGGDAGYVVEHAFYPKALYKISDNTYYAVFEEEVTVDETESTYHYAFVSQNRDNKWMLFKTYSSEEQPIAGELSEFTQPSEWAKAEVEDAQKEGLVPELENEPIWKENATRLHFAQLAVQLVETTLKEKMSVAKDDTFVDCRDVAVLKAYKAGIINGVGDNKFAPDDSLTREQLATMLWRTIKYIQKEKGKEVLKDGGSIAGFSDAESVSDYAVEAVCALSENGIMKGTSDSELSPQDSCSVEQSVLLIYRTFDKLK